MNKRRITTEAQKAASRANGRKSIGAPRNPRVTQAFDAPAAKRLAKLVLLEGESPTIFLTLARQIHEELAPKSHIELILSAKILLAYWRQMRAWSLERSSITQAVGSTTGPDQPIGTPTDLGARGIEALGPAGRFTLSEYEARYDRQFSRSLAAFLRYREAQAPKEMSFDTPTLGSERKQSNFPLPDPEE